MGAHIGVKSNCNKSYLIITQQSILETILMTTDFCDTTDITITQLLQSGGSNRGRGLFMRG